MITTNQVLEILGCNRNTITSYIKKGILPVHLTVGRTNYFLEDDVKNVSAIYETTKQNIPDKYSEKKIQKKNPDLPKLDTSLNDVGEQVVRDITDELQDLGLYRDKDIYPIMDLARVYQAYMYHFDLAMSAGGIMYDAKGNERVSNHMALYITLGKIVDDKRVRLGLDPASRQKLTINQKKDIDDMGDLF